MRVVKVSKDLQVIEPDYTGIEKVLLAFVELYKSTNDKSVVDKVLERTLTNTPMLLTPPNEVKIDGLINDLVVKIKPIFKSK
jgi:hypothetical protein